MSHDRKLAAQLSHLISSKQFVEAVRFYEHNFPVVPERFPLQNMFPFSQLIENAYDELLLDSYCYLREFGMPSKLLGEYAHVKYGVAKKHFTNFWDEFVVGEYSYEFATIVPDRFRFDAQSVDMLAYLFEYGMDKQVKNITTVSYDSFDDYKVHELPRSFLRLHKRILKTSLETENYELAAILRDEINKYK